MLTQQYLSFLVNFWGDYRFTVLQSLSMELPSDFFTSNFQPSMTKFHHKLLTRECRVLQMDELIHQSLTISIHLFITSVIQKVTIVTLNII